MAHNRHPYFQKINPMKLSNFKLITAHSEIKKTDFIVIVSIGDMLPEKLMKNGIGKITYKDKDYSIRMMKGMYSNFVKQSEIFTSDKAVVNKLKAMGKTMDELGFVIVFKMNGLLEIFAHSTFQGFITNNHVFSYPEKVDVELDDISISAIMQEPKQYQKLA